MNISQQLVNGFIQTELELFIKQFDETLVADIQDERSLTIAWLCYYFKDIISPFNKLSITDFVEYVYEREDYNRHGWYRIPALEASAFILTSNIIYANNLSRHIGCGQGWARGFIIQSASIICPLLTFNNQYLREATETNIKYSHAYYEDAIILYLSSRGTGAEKKNWIEQQINLDQKKYHIKFLNALKIAGNRHQSGFFVKTFNKVKSYFIFKVLSQPILAEIQPTLFDDSEINFNLLIEIEKEHPLNDYYIDLSFLKKED